MKKMRVAVSTPATIGYREDVLERRERILASRAQANPVEENLRRLREAEYPSTMRPMKNRW